ncbi:hypothetical protein PM082_018866 [Marasmius tenuissimus]|nr:hypothetical protein PM082_018866 [Marasmius tenuissimus]
MKKLDNSTSVHTVNDQNVDVDHHIHGQTHYMPIVSPPTPAPSPGPDSFEANHPQALNLSPGTSAVDMANSRNRMDEIHSFLSTCTPSEILYISQSIAPLLKRDFLRHLPVELSLHILTFIDDPMTLAQAACVSRWWNGLIMGTVNESGWRRMCLLWGFPKSDSGTLSDSEEENSDSAPSLQEEDSEQLHGGLLEAKLPRKRTRVRTSKVRTLARTSLESELEPLHSMEPYANLPMDPALEWIAAKKRRELRDKGKGKEKATSTPGTNTRRQGSSYREHFIYSYRLMTNWQDGGRLLRTHRTPTTIANTSDNVITSLALNEEWVIVGLANSRIHVFSGKTGVLARTLVGHDSGVWAVCLIAPNGKETRREAANPASGVDQTPRNSASPPPRSRHSWDELPANGRSSPAGWTTQTRSRRKQKLFIAPFDEDEEQDRPDDDHYVPSAMRVALGLGPEDITDDGDAGLEDVPNNSEEALPRMPYPDSGKPSEPSGCSEGWGQPNAIVVSGGCDKTLRVWDVMSGYCIYVLRGHTSTIRCIKVLHNRPIAVSGSRDMTLRVWDVRQGMPLRVLRGHSGSVRCLDVCGNKVVSGSYDCTLRLWDVDTGECLHVFSGHFSQVYSVAFDGVRVVSGGLDTTVRVWDPVKGHCLALLQGHAALVCQVQLAPSSNITPSAILVTGGSDGRVITYTLPHPSLRCCQETSSALLNTSPIKHRYISHDANTASSPMPLDSEPQYGIQHRLMAHDSSVTALQFDDHWLVTGGNDGRVKLWDVKTGRFVRELGGAANPVDHREGRTSTSSKQRRTTGRNNSRSRAPLEEDGTGTSTRMAGVPECVWKAGFSKGGEIFVAMVKSGGKSVMEIWSMRPDEVL